MEEQCPLILTRSRISASLPACRRRAQGYPWFTKDRHAHAGPDGSQLTRRPPLAGADPVHLRWSQLPGL
jgi:hypothetical protein